MSYNLSRANALNGSSHSNIRCILKLLYDNGATVEQVRGLILASTQCSHFLHMRCHGIVGYAIYWQSYYGRVDNWETLRGTFCHQGW